MRDYEPYFTEDGSIGLYSYADNDVFHSKFGALTEAWEKFIIPANIDKIENIDNLKVLDICYGIGYNTKALMSFLANKYFNDKKNLNKQKSKNNHNTETLHSNNIKLKKEILSEYIESIDVNKKISYNIDCLEINPELVKISPLLKTIKTPEEIFENFVPNFLNCFDTYYKFKEFVIRILSKFSPKNRKEINELLDLKFKNMHINKEYKINEYINYILINSLCNYYGKEYLNKDLKKILNSKKNKRFINKNLINYIKFNSISGHNYNSEGFLSPLLHNIYYRYLSLRYKKGNFKTIQSLFNVNYYIDDARKSILNINRQYDLIFLDAFTYTKAPQLWSLEFIAELYSRISTKGLLMTYSNSAQVRKTLLDNNFYVGKIYDPETKKPIGTIASKDKSKIEHPLDNYEIGLCNTKAGIPYHDPNLVFDKDDILALREYEFKHSNLPTSSQYIKMRNNKNDEENESI